MGNAEERPKSDRRDRTADMPGPQATAWGFCFDLLCWALPCPLSLLACARKRGGGRGSPFCVSLVFSFLSGVPLLPLGSCLRKDPRRGQGFALLFILGFLPAGNRKKPFLWLAFGNRSPVKYYGGKSSSNERMFAMLHESIANTYPPPPPNPPVAGG